MPYFTTAELRGLPDMGDATRFPDARLVDAHDWIASLIEDECGTSFIAQTHTETLTGSGVDALRVSRPHLRSVTALTVDGTVASLGDLAALVIQHGAIYRATGERWSSITRGNITVTYTAGYSTVPPAYLKQAALKAARNWLLTTDSWSGVDERATSITNEYGNINLAVAGEGRPTGLPDVDAAIMRAKRSARVPLVA